MLLEVIEIRVFPNSFESCPESGDIFSSTFIDKKDCIIIYFFQNSFMRKLNSVLSVATTVFSSFKT